MIEDLPNEAIVLIAAMPGELKPLTRSCASVATSNDVEGAVGMLLGAACGLGGCWGDTGVFTCI